MKGIWNYINPKNPKTWPEAEKTLIAEGVVESKSKPATGYVCEKGVFWSSGLGFDLRHGYIKRYIYISKLMELD